MKGWQVQRAMECCLKHYFDMFKMMACSLLADTAYNIDKTCVQLGIDKAEYCIMDRTIANCVRNSPQDQDVTTVIECIYASGAHSTPSVILGAKTHHS